MCLNVSTDRRSLRRGFTAIELIATCGAVGILAAIAVVAVSPLLTDVRSVKLENDVASINQAIEGLVAGGGDVSTITAISGAINLLKSTASQEEIIAGFRGSYVDPRLDVVMQSAEEAAGPNLRAHWDNTAKKLVLVSSGAAGVKEFVLNEALVDNDYGTSDRENMNKLAIQDDWIWDFTTPGAVASLPSQTMATDDPDEAAAPDNPDALNQLLPPGFTPEGDLFEFWTFPDTVALTNPNNPSTTQIIFSVNGGSWQTYTGPIPIERYDYVSAFVEPTVADPEIYNSHTRTESYRADEPEVSGTSTGVFKDAVGTNRLVSSIAPGDSDGTFNYGKALAGGSQNRLQFTGESFNNIRPDSTFPVGTLTYLNSTTGLGTSAYEVTLQIDLNFSSPNIAESVDVKFALESTANYPWLTADQKADFVRFGDLHTDFTTFFEGETYYLNLEFAYSGSDGYSTVDSFHVHEGKDASAQVVAKFSKEANEKPDVSGGSTGGSLPPPPVLP